MSQQKRFTTADGTEWRPVESATAEELELSKRLSVEGTDQMIIKTAAGPRLFLREETWRHGRNFAHHTGIWQPANS